VQETYEVSDNFGLPLTDVELERAFTKAIQLSLNMDNKYF